MILNRFVMIVLDANVWISFVNENDSNHEKACEVFSRLDCDVFISEYVLVEVVNVLAKHVGKKLADDFIQYVFATRSIVLHCMSRDFLKQLMRFWLSSPVKGLSFVDQSLLMLSQRWQVVTFDKRLAVAIKNFKK